MNFLAHIYLSGDDELIRIGNFMADGIRGKDYLNYPPKVQEGVLLHRQIDSFTDAHPIFRQSTKRLHSKYHHYSGVIADMFYDHFLAKNWSYYCNQSLEDFANGFYNSLQCNEDILSPRTKTILPLMIQNNWLLKYRSVSGIDAVLKQMDYRSKNLSKMSTASDELTEFYPLFEAEFTTFFQEIKTHFGQ